MNLRRWAAAASVLMMAGAGTAVAAPAHAAPAAGCYGASCEGKDPDVYCADDARSPVGGVRIGQAYVELRYSPSCRAAWARISDASYGNGQFTPFVTVHRNSDGREYTCAVQRGATGCYTRMVNDVNVTSYAKGEWDSGARTYTGRTSSY
ncbi:YjfA family protein [Streptomyces europaeiscabiei]|uniref:DUF2690 domain-containing protein n=1 Tax=Streptomyces TaxID=1883 RepID=UPI000A372721|nr:MULTISPECIES: DUF2690 domain-containing protein [Streptomyces]MDX3588907.1 DUF2690 domain-containing protein [Streptomyces europaeiscabiei]MDX3613625.1 DUF2690 domain-containing protein [Streptomyces europaeiscabiei]MDX3637443.1 DUF2690 domain-containing protein [Streptomyces europaeiscabiei]MDX3652942.1 DUF2690 domain-containing protein [Streptomyces europaeiscabiei]WUD30009.1 YjfA family protein [Streptomyces europaeiscabiei]